MNFWKKKRLEKDRLHLANDLSPFRLQTADWAMIKNEKETTFESVSSAAGLFPMLLLSLIFFSLSLFFFNKCYSLACRGYSSAAGECRTLLAAQWHCTGTPLPNCGVSGSSEQFQTPGNVVNHLLLAHDGQDSTGTRLDLPKNKRLWASPLLMCWHQSSAVVFNQQVILWHTQQSLIMTIDITFGKILFPPG